MDMSQISQLFSSINWLGVGSIVATVITVIFGLIVYVCKSVGIYLLSMRTKQKHTWMAFVPVLQDVKVFNMAGLSSKAYIVFYCIYRALYSAKLEWGVFAPIAWAGVLIYAIGLMYARYQMAKNFGETQAVCVLNAIFEPFVLLYIVYKKHTHQYTPQYPLVDSYLKSYGLYEDPQTFEDPDAKPEPTFNNPKQEPKKEEHVPQPETQVKTESETVTFVEEVKESSPLDLNLDK